MRAKAQTVVLTWRGHDIRIAQGAFLEPEPVGGVPFPFCTLEKLHESVDGVNETLRALDLLGYVNAEREMSSAYRQIIGSEDMSRGVPDHFQVRVSRMGGKHDQRELTFVLRLKVPVERGDKRPVHVVSLKTDEGACV